MCNINNDYLTINDINQQILGLESHLQALDILFMKQESLVKLTEVRDQSNISNAVINAIVGDVYPNNVGMEGIGDVFITIGNAIKYVISKVFGFIKGIFKKILGLGKSNVDTAERVMGKIRSVETVEDFAEIEDTTGALHYMLADGSNELTIGVLFNYSIRYGTILRFVSDVVNGIANNLKYVDGIVRSFNKILNKFTENGDFDKFKTSLGYLVDELEYALVDMREALHIRLTEGKFTSLSGVSFTTEEVGKYIHTDRLLLMTGKRIVAVSEADGPSNRVYDFIVKEIEGDKKRGTVKITKLNNFNNLDLDYFTEMNEGFDDIYKKITKIERQATNLSKEITDIGKSVKSMKLDIMDTTLLNSFKSNVNTISKDSVRLTGNLAKIMAAAATDSKYWIDLVDLLTIKVGSKQQK